MSKQPYLHERDGALYVRVTYRINGQKRSKERRVRNAREAAQVAARLRHELGLMGPETLDAERMRFEDLLAAFTAARHSLPSWYLAPLEYFAGRRLRSITYGDLVRFRQHRAAIPNRQTGRPRAQATINREVEVLRQAILFAVRQGWLPRNPFLAGPPLIQKSEELRRDRIPTPEEEARLLAACDHPKRRHLRLLILATRDTGLRRSALRSLTWRCVDWANALLLVPPGNRLKKRPKAVGLTARLLVALREEWEAGARDLEARVFTQGDPKRSWATACRLAGIEGLRLNDLRHGYATDLMESGIPQHFAMRLAGHSNAEIHEIYTNIDARLARQAAEALDRLHEQRRGDEPTASDQVQ